MKLDNLHENIVLLNNLILYLEDVTSYDLLKDLI